MKVSNSEQAVWQINESLCNTMQLIWNPVDMYRVGQKKLDHFLRVDNFATVSDRKAYYMSKFCKFCLEKNITLAYQCV